MQARGIIGARLRSYGRAAALVVAVTAGAAVGLPQAAQATQAGQPRATTPTIAVSISPTSPVAYGTTVSIEGRVEGKGGKPTGTFDFTVNGTDIAGCTAIRIFSALGKGSCSTTSLPVGSDTIVLKYSGDSNYNPASSPSVPYTVTGAKPSITFTATPASSSPIGTTVTLRAALSATGATPTGSVEFESNGSPISGCSSVALTGGVAQCGTSTLALGADSLAAVYSGDSNYSTVTSTMTYTVTKLVPTVQLTASPASGDPAGGSVTLTAALSGSGATPTGTVDFESGGTTILTCGSATIVSGQAQCTTTALATGTDSLSAVYSGDSNYGPGTGNLTYVVGLSAPTVYLSVSPGASAGQYAITAVVVGAAGVPTGQIDFEQGSGDTTIPTCGAVTLSSGSAVCTTSSLTTGPNTLTAVYGGSPSYDGAQATITFNVALAVSQVDLTVAPPTGDTVGGTVTLDASVTSSAGTPTGTVDFQSNGSDISGCGSVTVQSTGNAQCTTSSLAVGTDELSAVYSGDSNNNPNSASIAYGVGQAVSVVTLTAAAGTTSGQYVLTAAVSGPAGVPTGVVDFSAGGTDISGCNAVTLDDTGTATCTTSSLVPGANSLSAAYSGDDNYLPGADSISFETSLANPTVTVSASPTSGAIAGSLVTLSATVAGSSVTPTGTVDFESNTVTVPGCGAVVLDTTGLATCTTSVLAAGSDDIVAVYSGDTRFNPSSGSLPYTVAQPTPAVYLSAAAGATSGQYVLTAVAVGSAGIPTGTVEFEQSGIPISGCTASAVGDGGAATCTTSSLTSGASQLVAIYSGDATYTSASDTISFDISLQNPQVQLTAAPATNDTFGTSVTLTATVTPQSGSTTGTPTGTVEFQAGGVDITGCSSQAVGGGGTATCTTTSLAVGTDALEALYSGDTNNNPMSASLAYGVGLATPGVALTAVKATGDVVGDSVTLTATLTGVGVTPTGVVTFESGSAGISGCAAVRLSSSGVATCQTKSLAAGTDALKAAYSGDSLYTSRNGTLSYKVAKAAPTEHLVSSPGKQGVAGAIVTFTATLGGKAARPTGSVTFYNGKSAITGCRHIAVHSAVATCHTEGLELGLHSVAAHYSGNSDYLTHSAKVAYTVIVGGYWIASSHGNTRAYGPVATAGGSSTGCSTVAVVSAVDEDGYWLVCSNGDITNRGKAAHLANVAASHIIAAAATPDGKGMWLLSSTGSIYHTGDAKSLELIQKGSSAPVSGIASTLDGKGLWVVHTDGSVTRYGDAEPLGFTGSQKLNGVICGITTFPNGQGYGLVAKDGGVFSFGTFRFFGSLGSKHITSPIVGMALSPLGNGYVLVAQNGTLYPFGSEHSQPLRSGSVSGAVVGIAVQD